MAFFNQFIDKGLIERLELVANSEFGRITYTDAIEVLKKNNKKFQFPVEWGVDIQTEHERYLTEVVFKKPVFVTDYPKEIKSFYMKQNACLLYTSPASARPSPAAASIWTRPVWVCQ